MEGSSSSASSYNTLTAFLILLIINSILNFSTAMATPENPSTEFIKTSCSTTEYPKLCFNSLSIHANKIQKNPKILATTALSISLTSARSTSTTMAMLSKTHGIQPREAGAMADCMEEIGDSIDELQKSMAEMNHLGGSNFGFQMSDIQTWVSAALTEDNTCMDGFSGNGMDGKLKVAVKSRVEKVAQLTSNALSLINSLVATHETSP